MRVSMRQLLAFVLLDACFGAVAWAQNSPYPYSPPPVLARLERLQRQQDICALVNRSGDYRLERRYAAKIEVFVGSLSPSELQEFEQNLNAADLRNISRNDVPQPMILDAVDQFLIDVYRTDGEQHLNFNSPDARKRFRSGIDPVLKWLDRIQKSEHTQLGESSASHCMPALTNADPEPTSEAGRRSAVPYLMLLGRDYYRGWQVESNCVVVYPDGRYRREKSSQEYLGKIRLQAVEGSLNSTQVGELRTLFDAAELQNMKHDTHRNVASQEADVTWLEVPRQSAVQRLRFAHYFQVRGDRDKPGGYSGLQYGVEPDEHVLNPVREWLKNNVDKQKLAPVHDSTPTNCEPGR
jgi:hypothetical protein